MHTLPWKLLQTSVYQRDGNDPSREDWWISFTELENLRNEIIHTKQSKSEERYAKLLSESIFNIVRNHKNIIKFYGEHISRYKTELLEEFPYEFDYDDVIPGLMTDKNYFPFNFGYFKLYFLILPICIRDELALFQPEKNICSNLRNFLFACCYARIKIKIMPTTYALGWVFDDFKKAFVIFCGVRVIYLTEKLVRQIVSCIT